MSIAKWEAEKAEMLEQLEIVLLGLEDAPDNSELVSLKAELDRGIADCDEILAELRPANTTKSQAPQPPSAAVPNSTDTAPPPEKWSRDDHPAFKKAGPAAPSPAVPDDKEPEMAYQVNDNVMAKWVSGDKAFYAAHITSVTGSSTAPIYTVKFKSYDTVETLRARDIRPVASAQKRKADGTPVAAAPEQSPAVVTAGGPGTQQAAQSSGVTQPAVERNNNGVVLSASATRYVQPQAGPEAAGVDEAKPVKKFKKIKATKELEKGKSNWQDFNNKSKFGKTQKKDSMFRTPEGIHGRVGFTGSGQAMRKDPSRSRHVYQPNEELD